MERMKELYTVLAVEHHIEEYERRPLLRESCNRLETAGGDEAEVASDTETAREGSTEFAVIIHDEQRCGCRLRCPILFRHLYENTTWSSIPVKGCIHTKQYVVLLLNT